MLATTDGGWLPACSSGQNLTMAPDAVSHTISRSAYCTIERLFDVVVAEDVLPKVLHRYLLLPAVVGTTDVTGPWSEPGSQRRVLLGNGDSLREQVTEWVRPVRFAYRVDSFPAPLRGLVDFAEGRWAFDEQHGRARFVWTYQFHVSRRLLRPAVGALVRGMWAGYMARCGDRCVELALDAG